MLKSLLLIVLALVIALGGCAGSVWLMMEEVEDFGALTIGEWSVNPTEGTPQADPYAKAGLFASVTIVPCKMVIPG